MSIRVILLTALLAGHVAGGLLAQDRDTKVRNDRAAFAGDENWVYNDPERGMAEARASGKPLLVVLRCVP